MRLLFSRHCYLTELFTTNSALLIWLSSSLVAVSLWTSGTDATSIVPTLGEHHSNGQVARSPMALNHGSLLALLERRAATPGQRCGTDNHRQKCATGQCCSPYGWCGVTAKHCGHGCQHGYGKCNEGEPTKEPSPPSPSPSPSPPPPNDTDPRDEPGNEGNAGGDNPGLVLYTCKLPRSFAMTFDDGPGKLFDRVIDTLDRLNVKATFFVNGNNVANLHEPADRKKLWRAYQSGHQIASHTYSHADLDQLNDAGIRDEMEKLDHILKSIIGRRPVYMRPPYGNANANTQRTLNMLGYRIVNWNIDTLDWQHPQDAQASLKAYREALDRVPTDRKASFISLQHDIQPSTATNLIEDAVRLVRQRGFRLMRVDECMGDANGAYRP